jgi:hypothetical protein
VAQHSIAELTDDRVLYRSLEPVDATLPGLRALGPELGLAPGYLPRKRDAAYAQVVLEIARIAQRRRDARIGLLLVLGDTDNDRYLGRTLAQISGVPTFTFIGCEKPDLPSELVWHESLATASRWSLITQFIATIAERHDQVSSREIVALVDIDKTLLGPRGRSDGGIDAARVEAAELTAAALLGDAFNIGDFRVAYRELCRSSYHPFTEDNQDFVAYTALLISTGASDLEAVRRAVQDGSGFAALIARDGVALPDRMQPVHRMIVAATCAGDPTPFKQFRHQEFATTTARMLNGELPLCGELFAALTRLRNNGALCIAASDKPDEASLPDNEQRQAGMLPLHHTPAFVRG